MLVQTPPTLIQDLLSYKKPILTTNCVYLGDGGEPTDQHCDGSSWAETDASREYLKTVDPKRPLFLDYGGALRDVYIYFHLIWAPEHAMLLLLLLCCC